jgi:hypothetical protein
MIVNSFRVIPAEAAAMISHPGAVADLIKTAAASVAS